MKEPRHVGVETAPGQHGRRLAAIALKRMGRRQPCGQPMPVHRRPARIHAGGKGCRKGLGQPVFMIKSKFHCPRYRPNMVKRR